MKAQAPDIMHVVKKVRFSSSHFFHLPHLSDEENARRFGPTANRNGHGHNYELEATVAGACDPQTGMVINLKDLKTILNEEVIQPLDFNSLNHDVPYFSDKLPTLENLTQYLWPKISSRLDNAGLSLQRLRIYEADDMYAEFSGQFNAKGNLPVIYLTRRYDFCATHRLYNPAFSDEQNCEVFRECNNPNGHGHNYELEVTVCGEPASETGMIIDLCEFDETVKQHVVSKVDHKNMNLDVDFLTGVIPTAELMAKAFWEQLEPQIPSPAKLYKVRLVETKKNYAEYYGK